MLFFSRENRFDILIFECLLLGFLIGFLSFYYQTTYLLIVLLFIHILGTLYTEHRLNLIVEFGRILLTSLFNSIFSRRSSNLNVRIDSKKLPEKYLYNYRLTPSQQVNNSIQTKPLELNSRFQSSAIRPGISNLHGTTCSLNALMQSLASLNQFCSALQRNINVWFWIRMFFRKRKSRFCLVFSICLWFDCLNIRQYSPTTTKWSWKFQSIDRYSSIHLSIEHNRSSFNIKNSADWHCRIMSKDFRNFK